MHNVSSMVGHLIGVVGFILISLLCYREAKRQGIPSLFAYIKNVWILERDRARAKRALVGKDKNE